jgi:DNA-binding LacI/PurR family transcriptional regulator
VVCNDYLAARVMQFIKKTGFRVPEDIAITGTDNTNIAGITSPALTSVDFNKKEFAKTAAETLLALINGQQVKESYFDVSLVIRESV